MKKEEKIYNELIEKLWTANGEGLFEMSPEDFVQAVNDIGLYDVYVDEVVDPETDILAEQVYHPTVINGTTIWDDRLSDLKDGVNVVSYNNAVATGTTKYPVVDDEFHIVYEER